MLSCFNEIENSVLMFSAEKKFSAGLPGYLPFHRLPGLQHTLEFLIRRALQRMSNFNFLLRLFRLPVLAKRCT